MSAKFSPAICTVCLRKNSRIAALSQARLQAQACCRARSKCDSPDNSLARPKRDDRRSGRRSKIGPGFFHGIIRQPDRFGFVQHRRFAPGQQQNPLAYAHENDGRDQHEKSPGHGGVEKVVEIARFVGLYCSQSFIPFTVWRLRLRRSLPCSIVIVTVFLICSCVGKLEIVFSLLDFFRLCQKSDARIRMPDFLHARRERHRHQPDQWNQSDERERWPYVREGRVPTPS